MIRILPHIFLLAILSGAEGFRIFAFFHSLTGSFFSGVFSAALTVSIVIYLAFYDMEKTSIGATILCIILSFASFLEPFEKLTVTDTVELEKSRLSMPEYEPEKYLKTGIGIYLERYKAETKRVQDHNRILDERIQNIKEKDSSKTRYILFAIGVFTFAVGVPVLTLLVAHRAAFELHTLSKKKKTEEVIGRLRASEPAQQPEKQKMRTVSTR